MPDTEAGKRLLSEIERLNFASGAKANPSYPQHIAAIEAEAVIAERERITREVNRAISVVFMPEDIERIHAGEALPILPRHAVLVIVNPKAREDTDA